LSALSEEVGIILKGRLNAWKILSLADLGSKRHSIAERTQDLGPEDQVSSTSSPFPSLRNVFSH
jgi:hypothetical protein